MKEVVYRRPSNVVATRLLYRSAESTLELVEAARPWAFTGSGELFRLACEAYRIRLAALFDPLLGVHSSLVQPLPHQILAVYETMLQRQPLRFLLADDPGAGKTIMAGLLIRELMARGDVERCLVVAPGSLTEQWQDELRDKFHLIFQIATNENLEAAASGNWFSEHPLVIARLDKLSRNEDLQAKLERTHWDLVIVDEAHKMSASYFGGEAKFTRRYQLGVKLSQQTRHFLLMTATPHNGKEEDFQLFMALLDGDRFEGRPRDAIHTADCSDMMRRMVKEQLLKFDGTPLFPERRAYTAAYKLSDAEAQLYRDVTDYVREEFNRAESLENDGRKGTVGFALTILQRRLASSPEAIYQSLKRRRERLERLAQETALLQRGGTSPLLEKLRASSLSADDIAALEDDDAPAPEVETEEEELASTVSAAATLEELRTEIEILRQLEDQAQSLRRSGVDRKWDELSRILTESGEMFNTDGSRRKLIIFTEHRDTLTYLKERISTLLGRPEAVVIIQGGMGRDARRNAEERFKQDKGTEVLIATDAAGEGINLQRAHLMVNYDLPWNPNRIEQRFGRIHRIGQTEVCHLWNLVASETREGEVYHRLLEKLEAQRSALGGRVFDVLGRLFDMQMTGHDDRPLSLRSLIIDAIRYGELPETRERLTKAIDSATDQAHLRRLIDDEALARDAMDARKVQAIREDLERAEAQRLQPHYIQAFFKEAFAQLGGVIKEREKGRFEITRVPAHISQRDRQIGRSAAVLPHYERVTFEKSIISVPGKPLASFVCPGHGLLDSVLDLCLERNRSLLQQGSVLIDPSDRTSRPRLMFCLEHSLNDGGSGPGGEQRVVSKEVHYVEVSEDGQIVASNHAPYLDYQPATPEQLAALKPVLESPWLTRDVSADALRYAIEHMVPKHFDRVQRARVGYVDKATEAVKRRLLKEISHWDHRANELRREEEAGKKPKLN
ncbi:MAG: DEAD/DEAH box helicase, partial [Planctomycetaceae bacterium]|nr:DEAD/DEAH box helicase [Planctomycetaceae bacterium]